MRRSILKLAAAAAALAVLSPRSSTSQTTPDEAAARTLLATNLADAFINPPKGEDTNFFIRAGGVPNILFLVDSSGSMERLPPDGPAFYGGANPTMPPGPLLSDPGGALAQQNAWNGRIVVGCGRDPVGSADAAFAQNEMIQHIQGRKFYPPCGRAHTPGLVDQKYAGHKGLLATGGEDYGYESSVCPYYTPSNSQAVWPDNQGGYDPDFYNPAPNDNQIPNVLWAKDLVYHDSTLLTAGYERTSMAFKHNFGKGWAATSPPVTFPVRNGSNSYSTVDQFCDEQGSTPLANGQVPSTVCKQCLKEAGWYYDGIILANNQDGSGVVRPYPSIWYTGNYLSFFPPKFVIMRKIVKDIVATQSKVRMALANFGGSGMNFVKEFNPTCAHPDSSFDSNRSTYVSLLNGMAFSGGTPLSMALFDVGRYYHSPGLPWFGSDWSKPTGGSETWYSSSNSNDYAICYSCQTSSVIVLTDGLPNPWDGSSLPPLTASIADSNSGKYAGAVSTGIRGVSTTDCPGCAAFLGAQDYKNSLARVSWYLHNYDLRDDRESTKDCLKNGGKQTLDVYTVGYATRQLADANTILANAAAAGGGIFIAAEDPRVLKEGLLAVLEEINGRSTSFSVATVSTLQTTTGHSVIVPRFDPAKSALWKGHLYRYEMYSEFVNECDPSQPNPGCCSAGGAGDLDCDGECRSVFLQDAGDDPAHDPFFIQEGGDGFFYRNSPNTASCTQAPMCVAKGESCGDVGNAAAKPWWDAGAGLQKKKWQDRKVFTVVDSGARDRRIEADDPPVLLASTDTAARAILPYLGNGQNRVCNLVANRIETAGDAVTATVVRTNEVECAKTVIRWVLGADVFNEAQRKATDGTPWPPPRPYPSLPATLGDPNAIPPVAANLPNQEKLPDRPFKLGDVFHSSPIEVVAPLPRTGILCPLGLHNQCLQSLWRAPTGDPSSDDDAEYDAYATAYKGRRKVVLVGSNDGLVHAFNGGSWHADEDDSSTPGLDESQWPFNGYYDRGKPRDGDPDDIWAEELWAFLPPDMISKLALVLAGEHQLLVDGTAMVRDVWVDGTGNGISGTSATNADDVKQRQEFHTVAVFGERRGGTHYFALDITNATKAGVESGFEAPRLLWMYPQPDSAETFSFAETYTDFLPVAPPIGPVRIQADAQSGGPWEKTPEHEGVPFHERWIAFLSGGFDPIYVRGRGVHMVDVWTGQEYFDFSYPANTALVAPDDPRLALEYPIPATMGMVMWGPESRRENGLGYANAGFFDTATFGDTGGQLWTLRFHEPGTLGSDGKATNWFGARAFQMGMSGSSTSPSLGYAHPFFYITANTALPDGYIYRAYLGTGDRFNLLDPNGGVCGPDNIRACAMRGCTVDVELPSNYATTPDLGKQSGELREIGRAALSTSSQHVGTGGASVEVRAKLVVSACPSPEVNNGPTGFTKDVLVTCSADSAGRWGCTPPSGPWGDALALSNTSNVPVTRNWYYSIRIFDDAPQKRIPFKNATEAKDYDAARLWIRDTGLAIDSSTYPGGDFTIMAASDPNPSVPADPKTSAGWAIYYDHGPTIQAEGHTYNVNPLDERTSSVSGLWGWVSWNTTQVSTGEVTATNTNCFASKCTAVDRRVAYHYAAHPLTGGSVLRSSAGNRIRAVVGNTLVPAQGDQPTVFVNQKGQVLVGLTVVNPEKGAGSTSVGGAQDAVTDLGWMEVSEPLHACRHSDVIPDQNVCR